MLRNTSRWISIFALILAAAWATPNYAISKDFNQTYPLKCDGSFELQNVNGTVDIQGWDRDEVEVRAVKTSKQRESDLDRVSIDVDAKPNAVSVSTHYPQNEGVEVVVEYTVRVPHSAHVEHLGTINGTLRIAGVESVEDVHTVNGSVEIYEGGGNVHAHTTNGNIHLELARFRDKSGATADTTNGSVLVAIPSDTQADLEARCLNGNFFSELPVSYESSLRPREIHGKLGRGGPSIRLHTVNGGIRLVILRSTV